MEIFKFFGPLVGWSLLWLRFCVGKPSGLFSRGLIRDLYHLVDDDLCPDYNVEATDGSPADGSVLIVGDKNQACGPVCVLYIHGGGWVAGNARCFTNALANLSMRTDNALVCSVEYQLSPGQSIQSQLDETVAMFDWLVGQRRQQQVIIAGDSAGGALAALALQRLRGREEVVGGVLISPAMDMAFSSDSVQTNDTCDLILGDRSFFPLKTCLKKLTRNEEHTQNAYASSELSALKGDWAGLPPLYFWCAACEKLRDDVVEAAKLAGKAGVRVELEVV